MDYATIFYTKSQMKPAGVLNQETRPNEIKIWKIKPNHMWCLTKAEGVFVFQIPSSQPSINI